MATTPHPTPAPTKPPANAAATAPTVKPLMDEHGVATRDAEKDPNPGEVVLVGREQLERSEEMERMGLAKWQEKHDSRTAEERPKTVTVTVSR